MASRAFARRLQYLLPARQTDWVVYAKRPFSGPQAVLEYLSRYTHRVAISNSRIVDYDSHTVSFRWKDYRAHRRHRFKTMTLSADEFLRRFLIHILPLRFHRIRHFGFLANHQRKQSLACLRELPDAVPPHDGRVDETVETAATPNQSPAAFICRRCGNPMVVLHTLLPIYASRGPP
jgi:hypothetical protein